MRQNVIMSKLDCSVAAMGHSVYKEASCSFVFDVCPPGTFQPSIDSSAAYAIDHDFTGCPYCAISEEDQGIHTIPSPGCKLSQMITVNGIMKVSGVQGETPLHELVASGCRHFEVGTSNQLILDFLKLSGSICPGNTVPSLGGSIQVRGNGARLFAEGVHFIHNEAYHGGAVGVSLVGAESEFENCMFESNIGQAGTALYVGDGASIRLNGGENVFQNNVNQNGAISPVSVYIHVGSVFFDACKPGTFQNSISSIASGDSVANSIAHPAEMALKPL